MLAGVFLAINPQSASAKAFVIEGNLESDLVYANKLDFRRPFVVDVDPEAGTWRIDDPERKPRTAFTFNDILIDIHAHAEPMKTQFIASATLDHYPIDLDGDQRLLWFTYCATDYLRRKNGKPVIIPNGDARLDIESHSCRINTHWGSESDLCPTSVDFIYDRDLMQRGVEEMTYESGDYLAARQKRFEEAAGFFTNGEIEARFEVLSFTNVVGMRVPREWKLTAFFKGQVVKAYKGETQSVSTHERVEIPVIPAGAGIVDKRVRGKGNVNYVVYATTDGNLLSVDDPKVLTLVTKWSNPNSFRMPPKRPEKKKWFALGVLVAVLIPLVLLARMARKKT